MADQARRIEINGLNAAQALTAIDWINGLDSTGVGALLMEHSPVAGNPKIPQNVFRINVAGPDIAAFVTRIRNKVQEKLGRPPDLDENRSGDLQAIKDALQLYGDDINNREDLETALIAIWKNGARCMSGDDAATLQRLLKKKGFNNQKELRAWLRERP